MHKADTNSIADRKTSFGFILLNFEFKNDSFLTIYGDDTSKKNWGKYIIVVNKNNNTGYIELLETAQFLYYTRNIRYDWLYNIDENYVYLDWRKDNRQLFSEISFVRIVKIK